MIAAILGKGLIESYGWQSVFFAAGLPVLLIPSSSSRFRNRCLFCWPRAAPKS